MDESRARLYDFLGTMIDLGIPVLVAWERAQEEIEDERVRQSLARSFDRIRRGEPVAEAVRPYPELFPPLVAAMIGVGEQSGALGRVFLFLAERFRGGGAERESLKDRFDVLFELMGMNQELEAALTIIVGGSRDPMDWSRVEEVTKALRSGLHWFEALARIGPPTIQSFANIFGKEPRYDRILSDLAASIKAMQAGQGGEVRSVLFWWRVCLRAGLSGPRVAQFLGSVVEDPDRKGVFEKVAELGDEKPWAPVLEQHPDSFSPAVIDVVRVAEQQGDLERSLRLIEEGMERGLFLSRVVVST